jgi:hypothetical protein
MSQFAVQWMDAEARRRLQPSTGTGGTAFVSFAVAVDLAAAGHPTAAALAAAVADAASAAVSEGTLALALQARCGCAVEVAAASAALADEEASPTRAPTLRPSQDVVTHHKIHVRKHKKGDRVDEEEDVEEGEAPTAAALAASMAAAADPHGRRDPAARLAAVEADLAWRVLERASSRAALAELDLEIFERQVDAQEELAVEADAAISAAAAKAARRAARVVSVLDLQPALGSSRTLADLGEEADAANLEDLAWEGDRSSFATSAAAALAVVGGLMALFGATGATGAADAHVRRRGYEEMAAVDDTPL